jgi:hypothetical protein
MVSNTDAVQELARFPDFTKSSEEPTLFVIDRRATLFVINPKNLAL